MQNGSTSDAPVDTEVTQPSTVSTGNISVSHLLIEGGHQRYDDSSAVSLMTTVASSSSSSSDEDSEEEEEEDTTSNSDEEVTDDTSSDYSDDTDDTDTSTDDDDDDDDDEEENTTTDTSLSTSSSLTATTATTSTTSRLNHASNKSYRSFDKLPIDGSLPSLSAPVSGGRSTGSSSSVYHTVQSSTLSTTNTSEGLSSIPSSTNSSFFLLVPPSSPSSSVRVKFALPERFYEPSTVAPQSVTASVIDYQYHTYPTNNDGRTPPLSYYYPQPSPVYSLRTMDGIVCHDASRTSSMSIPVTLDHDNHSISSSIHTFSTVLHSSHIADGDDELVVPLSSRKKDNFPSPQYPSYSPLSTLSNNTTATELALRAISQSEQTLDPRSKPVVTEETMNRSTHLSESTLSSSSFSSSSSYPSRTQGKRVSVEAALTFRKRLKDEFLSPLHTTAEMRTRYLMFQKYLSSAVHSSQRGTGMYTTDTSPEVSNLSSARTLLLAACLANDDGIMLRMFLSHVDIALDIDGPLPNSSDNVLSSLPPSSSVVRSLSKPSSPLRTNTETLPPFQSFFAPSSPLRKTNNTTVTVKSKEPFLFGNRMPTPTTLSSNLSLSSVPDKHVLSLPPLSNASVSSGSQRLGSYISSSTATESVPVTRNNNNILLPKASPVSPCPKMESVPNTILQRLAQFTKPYNYPVTSASSASGSVATSLLPQAQSSPSSVIPSFPSFLNPRFISLGKSTPSHSTPLITCIYLSKAKESKEIRESALHRMKLLLAAGADPNFRAPSAVNSLPFTPLMIAVRLNQPKIVQLLLTYGADPNASRLPDTLPQGKPRLSTKFLSKRAIQRLQHQRQKLLQKLSTVKADLSVIMEENEMERKDNRKETLPVSSSSLPVLPSPDVIASANGHPVLPPPPTETVRFAAITNLNPTGFVVAPASSTIGKINNAATVRFDERNPASSANFSVPIGSIRSTIRHPKKEFSTQTSTHPEDSSIDFDKDIDNVVDPLLDADEQAGLALPNILYTAISLLSLPIIHLLLQYNAVVDSPGPNGFTPLRYLLTIITPEEAESSKVISIVQLLLAYGANVHATVHSTWEYRESSKQLREQKRQRERKKSRTFQKQLRLLMERSKQEEKNERNGTLTEDTLDKMEDGLVGIDTNNSVLSMESKDTSAAKTSTSTASTKSVSTKPKDYALPVFTTVPKLEVNMDGTILNPTQPEKILYKYRLCNDGRCIDVVANRNYVTLFQLLIEIGKADPFPSTFDWTPTTDLYGKTHLQMNDFDYIYRSNQRYGTLTSSTTVPSNVTKLDAELSSPSSRPFTPGFHRHIMDTLLPGSVPQHLQPNVSKDIVEALYNEDGVVLSSREPSNVFPRSRAPKEFTNMPNAGSKTFASSVITSASSSSTVRYVQEMDGVTYDHKLFREGFRVRMNYVETAFRKGYQHIINLAAGYGIPVEQYRQRLLRRIRKEKERRKERSRTIDQ